MIGKGCIDVDNGVAKDQVTLSQAFSLDDISAMRDNGHVEKSFFLKFSENILVFRTILYHFLEFLKKEHFLAKPHNVTKM